MCIVLLFHLRFALLWYIEAIEAWTQQAQLYIKKTKSRGKPNITYQNSYVEKGFEVYIVMRCLLCVHAHQMTQYILHRAYTNAIGKWCCLDFLSYNVHRYARPRSYTHILSNLTLQ